MTLLADPNPRGGTRRESGERERDGSLSPLVAAALVRRPRRKGLISTLGEVGWPIVTLALLLVVWEAWVQLFHVPKYLLAPPSKTVIGMVTDAGFFLPHALVTLEEVVAGFVLAVLVAVPLSLAIVSSPRFEKALYPLLVASQVVPKVAIAPLFMLWLGFGIEPKILIVVLIAFFPVVVNTVIGLKSIEIEKVYLARSMGASGWQTFWKFQLPHALPHVFAGLKLAATFSVIGAVVGEFIGADRGLGHTLLVANGNLDTVTLFAAVGYLTFMGVAIFVLTEIVERLTIPWHVSQRIDAVGTP